VRWRTLRSLVGLLLLGGLCLLGCSDSGYPEVKEKTFIGKSVPCAQCDKRIEKVIEQNLMTFEGIVYPVCSEKCAEELKAWLKEQ